MYGSRLEILVTEFRRWQIGDRLFLLGQRRLMQEKSCRHRAIMEEKRRLWFEMTARICFDTMLRNFRGIKKILLFLFINFIYTWPRFGTADSMVQNYQLDGLESPVRWFQGLTLNLNYSRRLRFETASSWFVHGSPWLRLLLYVKIKIYKLTSKILLTNNL